MHVETFVAIADRQFKLLRDLSELDSYFMDCPPESWKYRATRADRRNHAELIAGFYDLPSIDKPVSAEDRSGARRFPLTRVATARKIFGLDSQLRNAAQEAIAECDRYSELTELKPLIIRFTATHSEWVGFGWADTTGSVVTNELWRAERSELQRLLTTRNLLCNDHKKNEWERWKSLLTTQDRRDILDAIWLAKRPLLRSEIDPNAGDGFRQKVMHIKEVAERAKPRINWTIESDSKRRWSKKWIGD